MVAFLKPTGWAEWNPALGSVTGPRKAGKIHKGFGQKDRMAVALLPILTEPFEVQGQDLGGKIGAVFGQDQKAHIVGDQVQAARFERGVPTDPGFPMATLEGSGSPNKQGDPLILQGR